MRHHIRKRSENTSQGGNTSSSAEFLFHPSRSFDTLRCHGCAPAAVIPKCTQAFRAAAPALSPFESLTSDQRFCTSEKQRRGTWYRARRWTQRVHKSLVDGGVSSSLQDGKLLGSAYGSQAPDLCY
jgi:hypothetical protein